MPSFFEKLRRVHWNEMADVWKLPVSAAAAPFYKLRHKDLWIVCEDKMEARDNGYWFFKYVNEKHPEQECVYAVSSSSVDFDKISKIGKTVEFGSLMHWIMYLASTKKISSQKAGNPNAAIFYFLEVYGLLRDERIFLQHGITKDDAAWLYYQNTRFRKFICGAFPEYTFIKQRFGYPDSNLVYTGFPRFDGLHDFKTKRIVLIMPTWREWIADEDHRLKEIEGTTEIPKTNYFVKWNAFLNDPRIDQIAEKYHVQFVFFPHRNMQKYMQYFPKSTKNLKIMSGKDYNIQDLLKEAALMVTDYSSVFFDFFYMKKPVVFYQFDYQVYRKEQYSEGYFNYKNNAFSNSVESPDDVFSMIETYVVNNFQVSPEFLEEHKKYFHYFDTRNCERIFNLIFHKAKQV